MLLLVVVLGLAPETLAAITGRFVAANLRQRGPRVKNWHKDAVLLAADVEIWGEFPVFAWAGFAD